jgi:hypothetical protein
MSSLRQRIVNRKRTWGAFVTRFFCALAFLTVVYVVAQFARGG